MYQSTNSTTIAKSQRRLSLANHHAFPSAQGDLNGLGPFPNLTRHGSHRRRVTPSGTLVKLIFPVSTTLQRPRMLDSCKGKMMQIGQDYVPCV